MSPVAARVVGDDLVEMPPLERRPILRHEKKLAIHRLPRKEAGEPLLPARADDDVRVGNALRPEMLLKFVFRDAPVRAASIVGKHGVDRSDDLRTTAIGEADAESEPAALGRFPLGLRNGIAHAGWQALAFAKNTDANILF